MRARYLVWNPKNTEVVLASGERIPADGFGTTIYLRDEMFAIFNELDRKGLRPCLIRPCRPEDAACEDSTEGAHGVRAGLPASRRQREYFNLLTGEFLPPGTTRIQASKAIDTEIERDRLLAEEEEKRRQSRKAAPTEPLSISSQADLSQKKPRRAKQVVGNVLPGRFLIADAKDWEPSLAQGVTVLIDLSDKRIEQSAKGLIHLHWPIENLVDAKVLEGVVRLCASASQGVDQRVLLVGCSETNQAIAACVLRELFAIDAKSALGIIRSLCARATPSKQVLATIEGYRVS